MWISLSLSSWLPTQFLDLYFMSSAKFMKFFTSILSALFLSSFLSSSIILSMCLSIYRERDFKELVHTFVEVGKSRINRIGWQAGKPREEFKLKSKVVCWQEFPLIWRGNYFSAIRFKMIVSSPLTLWGVICFTQNLLIYVNLSKIPSQKYLE